MRVSREDVKLDDPAASAPAAAKSRGGRYASTGHLVKSKKGPTAQDKLDKAAASAAAEFIQDSSLDIVTLVRAYVAPTLFRRLNR